MTVPTAECEVRVTKGDFDGNSRVFTLFGKHRPIRASCHPRDHDGGVPFGLLVFVGSRLVQHPRGLVDRGLEDSEEACDERLLTPSASHSDNDGRMAICSNGHNPTLRPGTIGIVAS